MPILTAQPTPAELERVPHHLIGTVPLGEPFDAQRYADQARATLAELAARGKPAVVVGGTGLYFRALFDGFAAVPPASAALRAELGLMSLPDLVARLERADPAAPAQLDARNPRRVARAIEIVETSGRPLAEFRATPRAPWPPGLLLTRDREELRGRIAANVAAMFHLGVEAEVRAAEAWIPPGAPRPAAFQAIGFAEISALLRGEISRPEAQAAMTTATHQYAKRQLTWFRNQTTFRALDLTASSHPSQAAESALHALDLS